MSMTPALARRLGKAVSLLASPHDGEVVAAARAAGRILDAAGMDWPGFVAMVAGEAARHAAPAFTFRGMAPRSARKLMAALARLPVATAADRVRLERLRERLHSGQRNDLTTDELDWLDALWRAGQGATACP